VACLALLLVAASIAAIATGDFKPGKAFDVGLVAVVVTIAGRIMLHVRIGSSRHTQSLTDTAIMLGLMILPWPWLVLSVASGVTVAKILARVTPKRVVFNASKDVITVGLATFAGWLLGLETPFHPTLHRIPALIVVAVVILVTDEALAIPVVALANRHRIRDVFVRNWHIRIGGSLVRLMMAISAGYFLRFDLHMAVATPLLVAGLHVAYANRVQQRADNLAWQRLARIADALGAADEYAVRRAAVLGAAELFSCDEVDLEIVVPGAGPRLLRGNATAITYAGPPEDAPQSRGMVVRAVLDSHDAAATSPGELRLRFNSTVTFTERELYTLRALAAALGTAVRKASAVTEAARMATHQAHAATHDELTGLANRRHLIESSASLTDDDVVGMVVLDLNQFKQINDTLGQPVGDQVLVAIAERMPTDNAIAARLGGDEFAVMFTDLDSPSQAFRRTRALVAKLAEPIEFGNHRLEVAATAGIAVSGARRDGIDELLRQADVAMYQAKDEGQPIALYVPDRDTADADRLSLSADLVRAVAERQFVIVFQPIVDLATGVVISAEALARWYHPRRGQLAPLRFLGAIERSGLLAPFTEHVLHQALAGANRWRSAGFTFPVAVNISPRSLLDPSFPDSIPAALAVHDLPPEALTIELTETLTLSQLEVVDDVLHALHDMGINLALDDFGTGFSTLAAIARVPVHELKIDRTFVAGMTGTAESAILRTTIELGRSLGLLVVAEGIENAEQRERLWSLGCPAGQGHLFARPMGVSQMIIRLHSGHDGVPGRLAAPMHPTGDVIRLPAQRRSASGRAGLGQTAGTRGEPRRLATPAPTPHNPPDTGDSQTWSPE
jgi:diguanylate cyclase (GGDEF)-like protein